MRPGRVVMGVALNRLREPLHDAGVVPLELQPLLGEALREVAAYIAGGADAPRGRTSPWPPCGRFGRGLEALLARPSRGPRGDAAALHHECRGTDPAAVAATLSDAAGGGPRAPAVVEEPEEEGGHAR
ncbi:hypothetical protein ACPA9J_18880 [Pseudomonas aeruginosa]